MMGFEGIQLLLSKILKLKSSHGPDRRQMSGRGLGAPDKTQKNKGAGGVVDFRGGKIGASLCEDDRLDTAKEILEKAQQKNVSIHLPEDSVIADKFAADANTKTCPSDAIPDGWLGLDIGPKAVGIFSEVIRNSKTILWNGPMGVFEMSSFEAGTKAVADSIVTATSKGAFSLIGGGDSVAAINKYNLASKVSYVSTGGGALLEYIEQGTLPGVKAIAE